MSTTIFYKSNGKNRYFTCFLCDIRIPKNDVPDQKGLTSCHNETRLKQGEDLVFCKDCVKEYTK